MLSTGPAVVITASRTGLPSRAKTCAKAWISLWSSLPDGPTAIRKVVGRRTTKDRAGDGCENQQPDGQHQKPVAFPFPAPERQVDCAVQSV
jgi:hypothetical protein